MKKMNCLSGLNHYLTAIYFAKELLCGYKEIFCWKLAPLRDSGSEVKIPLKCYAKIPVLFLHS